MAKRLIPPPLNRALIQKIVSPSKTSMLDSGIVAAVGHGSHDGKGKLSAVSLNEGDTSMHPEYGGSKIKHGEKNNPTSNQRRRPARSSMNYVVMQYLLCTKNKMPFDPLLVLKHFNAPVAEPSTVAPFL